MSKIIVWQQKSENPDNLANFNQICQWWSNLDNQEVKLAQRLIPESEDLSEIDWQPQRFDEDFTLIAPEIKGITLYGKKDNQEQDFNFTANKLELNLAKNQLFVYLKSRSNVIIRIWQPEINYQQIKLNNFKVSAEQIDKHCLVLLRDDIEQIEVNFSLNTEQQLYLLSKLAKILKLNAKLNLSPETLSELLNSMQK